MKTYWLSWICTEEDHRPVTYPPGGGILGWWCSGYDSDGNSVMCALVRAVDEDDAKVIVRNDWPEFDGEWRFIEERPSDWKPNDRFPLKDWMKERFERFNEKENDDA